MFGVAPSDDLQKRCLRGEDSAWRELYGRAFAAARSIALAPPFCFDAAAAEDIAQDTVVELTKQLAEVKHWQAFTGRVAHNKCVDRVRKRKEVPLASHARDENEESRIVNSLPAPEFLPESLDDNKALECLRVVVQDLGQPCRGLLHARFFDELSYAEVAVRVAMPSGQVGVYIGRCLDRLRKRIEVQPKIWAELRELMHPAT